MGEMAEAAIAAGAHQIILADTAGYATPDAYKRLVAFITSKVGQSISVFTHCHNDLGLAVANTLAGIEAGADEVQVTLGGIGERAGNASLELVAAALHLKADVYQATTNIKLTQLYPAYKELATTLKLNSSRNQPIFGEYVFGTAAGIHQQGILSDPDTYEFVKPQLFGREREFFVSRHSGKSIIKHILEKVSIKSSADLVEYFYKELIGSRAENSCMSLVQLEAELQNRLSKFENASEE